MRIHILTRMTAIALIIIAAIPMHLLWLRRRRQSLLPPIGSEWLHGSYLSIYKAEVIEQHPLTGDITISRVKIDDPLGLRTTLRVNAKKFLSSSKPYRERKNNQN